MEGAKTILAVGMGILGVAALAVFVGKNSQAPQVIQAFGTAFSNALKAVTGG